MWRPQFAYPTPKGCRDEDFVYQFDGSNTPMLVSISAGQNVPYIPLVLQQDASFYWRGWKVETRSSLTEEDLAIPDLSIKLRDPSQNDLSDGLVPVVEYGYVQNPAQRFTQPPVLIDPEIFCPAGGIVTAFLLGGSTLTAASGVVISLYGVKRFTECLK